MLFAPSALGTHRPVLVILSGVELEDLKFAAIGVVLAVSGMVALLLALTGVVNGVSVAAALALPGAALLVASHQLRPSDPSSARLAAAACVVAAGVWMLMCVFASSDGSATLGYLGLIATSLWGRRFLQDSLAAPWWARPLPLTEPVGGGGWIEELPDKERHLSSSRTP